MPDKQTPQEPQAETTPPKIKKVRDAGPDAMENPPKKWTDVDQSSTLTGTNSND